MQTSTLQALLLWALRFVTTLKPSPTDSVLVMVLKEEPANDAPNIKSLGRPVYQSPAE